MLMKLHLGKRGVLVHFMCVGIVSVLLSPPAHAWYTENHQRISRAAIELLPDWEKAMLGSAADALAEQYCMYPDWYRAALREKDDEKIALYKPYVQLPLLQDLSTWHKNEDNDSEICFYIAAILMQNAVKNLRAGDPAEAAQYMGTLLHFIEDNACPVHVVDNQLLAELLPVPEELKPFPLHERVEEPTFPFKVTDYEVKTLGTDIVEAATAFYGRFLEIRLSGRAQSVPVLEAIYIGNKQEADKGRAQSAVPAVKLIADVVHTICTIAQNTK